MADISTLESAQPVILMGANSGGVETYPAAVDSIGRLSITPNTASEIATFNLVSPATAFGNNKSMLALYNGSISGVLKIHSIRIFLSQTTAVAGVIADLRTYRITGLTGGTTLTPQAFDTQDSITSGIIARTGGTVSGEATNYLFRRLISTDEWGVGTTDTESFQTTMQGLLPIWNTQNFAKPIYLRPNEGLHIKCATNTTVSVLDLEILYTQE